MPRLKIWLLLLAVTTIFYGSSVFYGFSQDDFFHLVISRADSLKDFLNFFAPHPESWVFYRPLSTQLWYWLFDTVFGWSRAPLPMHVAALILHASNAYLVTLLLKKVFKLKESSSILGGLLYAANSVHFLSLFYIGATQQLLATFFGLLAILANLESKRVRELSFFLLSLLSKELAIRLVPIVFLCRLIQGDSLRDSFKKTLPIGIVTVVYLALRYLTGITTPPEYHFDFGIPTTIATVMWYGLMTLGAPEHILTYGLSAGRIDLLRYLYDFPLLGSLNLLAVSLLIVSLLLTKWLRRHLLYGLIWLAALAPVLFLPTHRYAHYLDLSLIPLLAILLSQKRKLLVYISVFAFITAVVSGQLVDRATHWTIKRATTTQRTIEMFRKESICDSGRPIYFYGNTGEAYDEWLALAGSNGPRIICNNEQLKVYYGSFPDRVPDNAYWIDPYTLVNP